MVKSKTFNSQWQKVGRLVYGLVGITGIYMLYYLINNWSSFFITMGNIGGVAYILATIGSINWGIKSIFGKDLFLN